MIQFTGAQLPRSTKDVLSTQAEWLRQNTEREYRQKSWKALRRLAEDTGLAAWAVVEIQFLWDMVDDLRKREKETPDG